MCHSLEDKMTSVSAFSEFRKHLVMFVWTPLCFLLLLFTPLSVSALNLGFQLGL